MLEQAYHESSVFHHTDKKINRIPVCYDEQFGIDLQTISLAKDCSIDRIIELHLAKVYRVYMLGFLPGFAYLGELEPTLIMPRKENPVPVIAGSVGIASNQTGIYPLNSPGGWQIVGRTPVKLFHPAAVNPVILQAGDEIQFYRITLHQFETGRWDEIKLQTNLSMPLISDICTMR
jgi:inhibitor of KinA